MVLKKWKTRFFRVSAWAAGQLVFLTKRKHERTRQECPTAREPLVYHVIKRKFAHGTNLLNRRIQDASDLIFVFYSSIISINLHSLPHNTRGNTSRYQAGICHFRLFHNQILSSHLLRKKPKQHSSTHGFLDIGPDKWGHRYPHLTFLFSFSRSLAYILTSFPPSSSQQAASQKPNPNANLKSILAERFQTTISASGTSFIASARRKRRYLKGCSHGT